MPTTSNTVVNTNKLPITKDQELIVFNAIPSATSISNIIVGESGVAFGSITNYTSSNFDGTTSTLALQGSNDNIIYGAVLQDDNTTAMSFTLAVSGTYTFILKALEYKYYKLVYTKEDATAGTLTSKFVGKKLS